MNVDASSSEAGGFSAAARWGGTALGAIISLSPIRSQQARVTAPAKFSLIAISQRAGNTNRSSAAG